MEKKETLLLDVSPGKCALLETGKTKMFLWKRRHPSTIPGRFHGETNKREQVLAMLRAACADSNKRLFSARFPGELKGGEKEWVGGVLVSMVGELGGGKDDQTHQKPNIKLTEEAPKPALKKQ